jgi:uncharacterized protein with von Willebrand factor type A (vWA) domain
VSGEALVADLAEFGRTLREGGAEVGPRRLADALRALDAVGLESERDVYFALRQTLVSRRDELELFDRAYVAWRGLGPPEEEQAEEEPAGAPVARARNGSSAEAPPGGETPTVVGASTVELLRTRDFASLRPDELDELRGLLADLGRVRPRRRSRRLRSHPRGELVDLRRLVRRSLRTGGEPLELASRTRKTVPRKLVVLCDVSGSMAPYTRALLLFLHATAQVGRVEAFAFGTRLARLTSDLATRDPEVALDRVSSRVVDWGSGTRIGAALRQFNAEYGRRSFARGAVVVVASDGWERDDPELVGREMARLARSAYAIVWVNPLKGSASYEPLSAGMRAALPYVDRFLPGHDLESFEELADVVAGIERRHAA